MTSSATLVLYWDVDRFNQCVFGHLKNPAALRGKRWPVVINAVIQTCFYCPQEADRSQWLQSWWNVAMLKWQITAPVFENVMRALTLAARLSEGRQISDALSLQWHHSTTSKTAPTNLQWQNLTIHVSGSQILLSFPADWRAPPTPALLSVWKPMFLDGSIWVHITQLVIKWKSVPHISSSLKINYLHRS